MAIRCALCPNVNACVSCDGPSDSDLLFVGEAPGDKENKARKPFVGPTGQEVDGHYLRLAGQDRRAVRFTNAIACLPTTSGGKLDPKRVANLALLDCCTQTNLYPLIERHPPKVLIPMGAFACRAICPEVDLDLQHGMPVDTAWGIPAFPMAHPARGLHEPKKMLDLRTDWLNLKKFIRGELVMPTDPYPNPDYQEVEYVKDIDIDPERPLAADTENTRDGAPFCLTYSQDAGVGRLIRATRPDLLAAFESACRWRTAPILFHFLLHDWTILNRLGLKLPRLLDTAALIYHLGNLPQGLKALSHRLLGMRMQDFDDLVTPHSTLNVLTYYTIAASHIWPKPEPTTVQDSKTGLWKSYAPQSMNTKLKRFFTDYGKSESEKDVFLMWTKQWANEQEMIEEKCGPWPGKCITHVPFEKTLYYACRDADALIRLWPLIQWMASVVRRLPQEQWSEYAASRCA